MSKDYSTPIERGKRLKIIREAAELSRDKVAQISGYGGSTIQFWEEGKGENGLPIEAGKKLVEIFNSAGVICTEDWLLYNVGTPPFLANKLTSHPEAPELIPKDNRIIDDVKMFHQVHTTGITLLVMDDAMEPRYQKGDFLGGDKLFGKEINQLFHQPCIIELQKNSSICRILKPSKKENRFDLICLNPMSISNNLYFYNIKIISAARVIWHRQP